jgi:hypothetical protein
VATYESVARKEAEHEHAVKESEKKKMAELLAATGRCLLSFTCPPANLVMLGTHRLNRISAVVTDPKAPGFDLAKVLASAGSVSAKPAHH